MLWLRVQVPSLDTVSISPSYSIGVGPADRSRASPQKKGGENTCKYQGWAPHPAENGSGCLDLGKKQDSCKGPTDTLEHPGLWSHCSARGSRNSPDPSNQLKGVSKFTWCYQDQLSGGLKAVL